jgi:hypothetical protein
MARRQKKLKDLLLKAKTKALSQTSAYLDTRFTEEISAEKWDYPTPPFIRDIVDTGRLRASQQRTLNSDGSVTFSWPVEYATQVHDGATTITGQRIPARGWTIAPLREFPEVFGTFFRKALGDQK